MIVNKKMKHKLTQANIDPYSSEGRSEIYCRFVLENPPDLVLKKNIFTVVVIFYPGVSHRVGRFDHSSHSCNSHVLYSHHLSTKFFFVSNNIMPYSLKSIMPPYHYHITTFTSTITTAQCTHWPHC